ncbi:hypothetical protein F4553_002427 [Allocatelliglobosispora scoriae]|uniref:YdhG-like domain-containing protein n=1 Tax=Allocatelliglobosispora scoriae TaxID=643052 RepID=A0A841BNT3_9ACTN|nr:DUF1801 domain-containing protein [Allocatelliglobosispora scoriae]MBB5869048.1 hypothetical protein [Allocatelliglobosispora scoriae]
MATAKKAPVTSPTGASVEDFLAAVPDARRQADARTLCALMTEVTGEQPVMWGPSIVGFGSYHYRYASGHEGDAPRAAFSPRKPHLVVYLVGDFETRHATAVAKLGPHTAGKGCLYLKRLDGIDIGVLRELIERTYRVAKGIDKANSD